jgi:hypothetical protein
VNLDSGAFAQSYDDSVMQGNGLVQSAQLVESIGAPSADAEANVDFGE